MSEQHIEDYDELTSREIRKELNRDDFSVEALEEIREYEQKNKDRITVIREIDRLIEDASSESAAQSTGTGTGTGTGTELDDRDGDSPDRSERTVDVTAGRIGLAGGYWFDDVEEVKTVERTRRVEMALESGELKRAD